MSDAWRVASITSFEQVPVGPATALLRVSATSAFRAQEDDGRPMLVADDGHDVSRFVSVPAPLDEGGVLRCAYPVPIAVVTAETVFSLEFTDGLVIALPDPTTGPARLQRPSGQPAAPTVAVAAVGEERRTELAPKLIELSEELASVRHEVEHLRGEAELGQAARARILHLHLEAVEASAELHAVRDLAALAAAAPGVAVPVADEARGAAERVLAANRERDAALEAQRAAEESVEPLRAGAVRMEGQLLELRGQVHKMSLERDESRRQASAFDAVAVKARARAEEATAEHQKSSARLAELETWAAELERRLAETTTQLAEARAGLRSTPPEPPSAARMIGAAELAEIGRSALADAHRTAERDLADATSSAGS
jgi:hypothetical protein